MRLEGRLHALELELGQRMRGGDVDVLMERLRRDVDTKLEGVNVDVLLERLRRDVDSKLEGVNGQVLRRDLSARQQDATQQDVLLERLRRDIESRVVNRVQRSLALVESIRKKRDLDDCNCPPGKMFHLVSACSLYLGTGV